MNRNNFLVVVAGPTAVGKTDLCVKLAKKLQCDIISADSRQFYKELSIGTAKPTQDEMQHIPHHFVNFLTIDQEFSAGKFELAVLDLLHELFNKNHIVLLTGGSGLYIQAVCQGMNEIPDVDIKFREELYQELADHGLNPLLQELRVKDPDYYEIVDRSNPQRIIRALEVCRGSGKPYSTYRTDMESDRDFSVIKIGLNRDRDQLFDRINRRIDRMIENGLFDEAERFYEFRNFNALKTVGYKEIFDFMGGKYDKEEAIRLLKRNSRRYAKRQLTWFKKDKEFVWFHPDEKDNIFSHIQNMIQKKTIGISK